MDRLVSRYGVKRKVALTGAVEETAPTCRGGCVRDAVRSRLLGLEVEAFGHLYLEAAAMGLPWCRASGGAPEAE